MAEATGVKSLTCEFCGETFERPQGLGAHRTRCAKNPNRRTWSTKPKTGKQQIERSMSRAVEENCCIADLRRRLISALRAERDRLDRELAVLTGAKEARDR